MVEYLVNVLCVQASPRKKGYTAELLDGAIKGIKSVNDVEYDLVHLRDYFPIHPCTSCWNCVKNKNSCVLNDSMGKNGVLFMKLCDANALFIAHPVYYGRPPAGLHLFFERFYPFMWSGKLNGMPFASISQASNNGGARTSQIDITRWAITFNLRITGGLPVHMVSIDEARVQAEELGKKIAEKALTDSKERKRVTPVERYLVSYEGQWSRLESSLMDMTNGTMQYDASLIAYALRQGAMKNEATIDLLHKAGEELKLSLTHYKNNDLTSAAEHMVKMSSFWSPATLREFLPNIEAKQSLFTIFCQFVFFGSLGQKQLSLR